MRRSTSRDHGDRHANMLARGQMTKADDTKLMQELQFTGYSGEAQQKIEYAESYGFTSVPLSPDQGQGGGEGGGSNGGGGGSGAGAEHFSGVINSGRSHAVTHAVGDRRHRLFKKKEGEVGIYDHQGQWIYLHEKGILIKTPNDKNHKVQVDKDKNQRQKGQYGQDASKVPDAHSYHSIDKDSRTVRHPTLVHHKIAADDSSDPDHFVKLQSDTGIINFSKKTISRTGEKGISDTAPTISHNGNTSVSGNLGVSGIDSAGSFATTSDARLKTNVQTMEHGLAIALQVNVKTFNKHRMDASFDSGHPQFMNGVPRLNEGEPTFGVIAQELREVLPMLVRGRESAGDVLTVDESKLGILAIAALQELVRFQVLENGELRERIAALEAKLA